MELLLYLVMTVSTVLSSISGLDRIHFTLHVSRMIGSLRRNRNLKIRGLLGESGYQSERTQVEGRPITEGRKDKEEGRKKKGEKNESF